MTRIINNTIFFLFLSVSLVASAQKDQDPDTLLWNGKQYLVTVDNNVPSILQVYYQRTGEPSPFTHWSSNNNRGNIATYELLDDGIYLVSIEAKRFRTRRGNLWAESGIDTVVTPDYFDMHLVAANAPYGNGPLLADWFSGVIQLTLLPRNKSEIKSDETLGYRYLRIEHGKIIANMLITADDLKRIEDNRNDNTLEAKRDMISLYKRYMNFYTRCALDREHVVYNGHEGLFEHGQNGLTLVMELHDNDPLRWDHNWNYCCVGYGAPFGSWIVRNDSLFLSETRTHWGEELYTYESLPVEAVYDSIQGLLVYYGHRKTQSDGSYFADWLNGDYVIHYGNWTTNNFGVPDYTVYKTQKLRVKDGIVLSSQFSPRSFEEDERQLSESGFTLCNPSDIYSVEDKQLAETVGNFKKPKKTPQYKGGKTIMRNWFANHSLTDDRARERLFRVRIGFVVNCDGVAGQWQLLNKSKGELFEFSNMVLDVVSKMPQRWEPAEDKKGNKVDCWQILEFTVSNGSLSSADYK